MLMTKRTNARTFFKARNTEKFVRFKRTFNQLIKIMNYCIAKKKAFDLLNCYFRVK